MQLVSDWDHSHTATDFYILFCLCLGLFHSFLNLCVWQLADAIPNNNGNKVLNEQVSVT